MTVITAVCSYKLINSQLYSTRTNNDTVVINVWFTEARSNQMRHTIKQQYFQNWWWTYDMKTLMAYSANEVLWPSFWLVTSGFVLWIFRDSVPGLQPLKVSCHLQSNFSLWFSGVKLTCNLFIYWQLLVINWQKSQICCHLLQTCCHLQ